MGTKFEESPIINSASCPFCKDGIGHKMDAEHAQRVREVCEALNKILDLLKGSANQDEIDVIVSAVNTLKKVKGK